MERTWHAELGKVTKNDDLISGLKKHFEKSFITKNDENPCEWMINIPISSLLQTHQCGVSNSKASRPPGWQACEGAQGA